MIAKVIKTSALLLSLTITVSLFAGCAGKEKKGGDEVQTTTQKQEDKVQTTTQKQAETTIGTTYPIKTDKKLTVYGTPDISGIAQSYNETPFAKELEKRTGVKVEYLAMSADRQLHEEKLKLMIATADLPDIIQIDALNWPGGPEKLMSQKTILKLNDLISNYAPNLKNYLDANPDVKKLVSTDEGSLYSFPFIRGDSLLTVYMGPQMRKDWLDELGLQPPTTIDEWYTVLKAFKDNKGAEAPLSFEKLFIQQTGAFIGAYGTFLDYYVDGGKVKYGYIEPCYKDFLVTFNEWYKEGLLDKNFASVDRKAIDFNMTTGKSGAAVGHTGSRMGAWLPAGQKINPKYDLVGLPYPTLTKGEKPKFGQTDLTYVPQSYVITGNCSDPELAAKWLDYGYGKEGIMYMNFGTEGVSYTMDNGEPKYTDVIMKNPDGLNMSQAMTKYIRANTGGAFIQDKLYIVQYLNYSQQKEAVKNWANTDALKYKLPTLTPTIEESQEFSKINSQVKTYVEEMFYKFIMGVEPIENFDKYVNEVKQLGLDRSLEIYNKALDRYNKR